VNTSVPSVGCRSSLRVAVRRLTSWRAHSRRNSGYERGEGLAGRLDVAALLEPRVPGGAHARELRDLLAAQPRCAPAPDRRDAGRLGSERFAPAAQQIAERGAAASGR